MKDINLLNYLSENNIDIPNGFNISVVRLPSKLNKSLEINRAKEENRHANMKFTFSDPNYSGLGDKFEWAQSCIIVSYSYISENNSNLGFLPGRGSVARFAKEDYYIPLRQFINQIKEHFKKNNLRTAEFIDNPKHYDRLFFEQSGLGWQGKSTMMLSPGKGPWQLIGNIYVEQKFDLAIEKDYSCGSCNLCQISCPTGALDEEFILDSNKCISYWLQSPDIIPHDMRAKIGNRFYGCDECLISCPPGQGVATYHDIDTSVDLVQVLNSDSYDLVELYNWFYIPKRNGDYLKRNAIIALANNPSSDTKDVFINLLKSNSDLVRFYCIWGLWKIGEFEIVNQYLDFKNEKSEMILQEYQRLNEMIYSNK